jgi:hypothetical protein
VSRVGTGATTETVGGTRMGTFPHFGHVDTRFMNSRQFGQKATLCAGRAEVMLYDGGAICGPITNAVAPHIRHRVLPKAACTCPHVVHNSSAVDGNDPMIAPGCGTPPPPPQGGGGVGGAMMDAHLRQDRVKG